MAITRTARFSLHRWDVGGDPMNRAQFDTDNLQVETLAAIFRSGPDANKPAAGDAANAQSLYSATDTGILYYNNNGTWVALNDYGEVADIVGVTIGAAASAGTGTEVALANHVHAVGTPSTPENVSTTAAAGDSTTPARANHVHGIATNAVTETTIAANAVVEAKIATGAVTEGKIGTGAVTEGKIGTGAVTEGKIGTAAITPLKIASSLVGNGLLRNGTTGVVTVKAGTGVIVDANGVSVDSAGITAGNIADDAISTSKIQNSAVIDTKIATDAVTPLKIASSVVGNGLTRNGGTGVISVAASTGITVGAGGVSISTGGITETLIGTSAVTEGKIGTGAVTETKIGTAAVTPLKIASTIVGTGSSSAGLERNGTTGVLGLKIGSSLAFDGTTGAVGIAANGVGETQIATGAVTPLKIASTVAGNGLSRNGTTGVISVAPSTGISVGAGGVSISTGGVTETLIADNAVTSAKLKQDVAGSEAVTSATIRDGAVTPLKVASTIVGTGSSSAGLERNAGTGVLGLKIGSTLSFDATTGAVDVAANGITATQLASGSVTTTQLLQTAGSEAVTSATIRDAAVIKAKAGAGVYVNHTATSPTAAQRILYTAEGSLPTDGATATGYTPGDIWFGF